MIDDFGLYPREEPFDPFSVMLFKALQVVAFLFFLALLAISPEAKDGKIDSKAEFKLSPATYAAPARWLVPPVSMSRFAIHPIASRAAAASAFTLNVKSRATR